MQLSEYSLECLRDGATLDGFLSGPMQLTQRLRVAVGLVSRFSTLSEWRSVWLRPCPKVLDPTYHHRPIDAPSVNAYRGAVTPSTGPLVAIVDDDELFRRAIARFVRSAGFRVETFGSAEDFLEHGDLEHTACAILDMKLPGIDGLDLQQQLISRSRSMPIVFISAHDETFIRAIALRNGAIAFLKKPFEGNTLLDALNRSVW
jgi:CheY-like chemotaxis protein